MTAALRVLLLVEVLGLIALPLAGRALARLPGGGLGFAKPLGLLLVAWLVWMAGSLGVPNGLPLALGAVAVVGAAGALAWRRPLQTDLSARSHLLAAEAVFLVAFLGAAAFIAFSPDVWGTEKPMDMAFLNAALVSPSFPPHDPWLAGEQLNYYYFGHLAAGLLVRLTGVEPTEGYNLALAVVFALAAGGVFSLAAALTEGARQRGLPVGPPAVAGAGAVVLVLLAGNLRGGARALSHDGPLRDFDWFGQSRVISDTINEFPLFSLLVQDLHAHVIVLPFTLLALAFASTIVLAGVPRPVGARGVLELLCGALAVGALYATNSWSWPVVAVLLLLAAGAALRDRPGGQSAAAVLAWPLGMLALGAALFLPFILEFDPNARGIGVVEEREGLGDFVTHNLLIYGALAWLVATLYGARLLAARHPLRVVIWGSAGLVLALSLLAAVDLAGVAIVAALAAVALHALLRAPVPAPERALWLLAAGGLACIAGPELLYVRDEFDMTRFFRMNTVFKLGYQAWVLLGLVAGCALAWAPAWLPAVPRRLWRVGAVGLIALSLAYTVVGGYARKDGFSADPRLDGRRWLALTAPGDVRAIDWIRDNTPRDAVVLEGVGDDYSAFGHGRISTYTGRATVLGWEGHELQWSHSPGSRRRDVRTMYTAGDPEAVRALLARYGVTHAVIGPIERTDYGEATTLTRLGRQVFESQGTAVYRLPGPMPAPVRREPRRRPEPTPPGLGAGG